MFKKVLSTTVLGVSVVAAMTANAAAPGIYVTGQLGYANTHMGSKTNFHDDTLDLGKVKNLSNNGLAGRVALGYQFNPNFAVEVGYLQLNDKKADGKQNLHHGLPEEASFNLQQHAIDLVGKGIIPVSQNLNVYGKLGLAYLTSDVYSKSNDEGVNVNVNLNEHTNIAKHKWAPEAAIGVSYDITPNVSVDASLTHIQPLGNNKPGNIDFAAVGLGYNFG